ncbi:MAG: sugar phosphate isomerase/epimerase family protein [Erysipelotrichaceae bacterium]
MSNNRIGVQFSTVKSKVVQLGVYGLLKELAEMGVKVVELSQVDINPNTIEEINMARKEFGTEICAMSAAVDPMMPGFMAGETLSTHFDKIVADCKAVGCNFLRIGMMPFSLLSADKATLVAWAQRVNGICEKLAEHDIELYYHNHHVEFKKVEGETILDILRDNAPLLGFELDIHWIQRGGYNPVEVINNYAGRIKLLHLKDYRIGVVDMSAMASGNMAAFMNAFSNVIEFAEVGEGNLDIAACIEAGVKGGATYFLIEQDTSYGKDPMACLKLSKENLETLGYGEWF